MTGSVERYYSKLSQGEWDRLERPFDRIEFMSTMRLIEKYLPDNGHVLDIGGGPGRYTVELLKRGNRVTLFDLSPDLVKLAQQRLDSLKLVAEGVHVGDARNLELFRDGSFDALLLMGPLYHLTSRNDRLQVLREARRVLKPGGRGLVAYLNAWGVIRTGLSDFPEQYENPKFVKSFFVEGELGIWYWSNLKLIRDEVHEAGFEIVACGGMEGFAGGMARVIDKLAEENPKAYDQVLRAVVESSEMPQYRDSTDHFHAIVT
jgi:ubiquinone/menaquinone biosynthesis C-methylase UbiE